MNKVPNEVITAAATMFMAYGMSPEEFKERLLSERKADDSHSLDNSEMLTLSETCEYMKCSRGHVYNLFKFENLKRFYIGGKPFCRKEDLDLIKRQASTERHGLITKRKEVR